MPDDPTPGPVPEEDAVRALLGSLRDPDPGVPPEVAARLEARLAELSGEPAESPDPAHPQGTVVRLPPRAAARRTTRGLLVAAAVAAVVGLGAVQVLDPLGGGSDSPLSADTATSADQPTAARDGDGTESSEGSYDAAGGAAGAGEDQSRRSTEELAAEESGPQALDSSPGSTGLPALTTRSFALEVAALSAEPGDAPQPPAACTPGGLEPGTDVRAVLLDSRPGVLALLPPGTDGAAQDSRVAEAWRCGDLAGPAGTAAPPRVRVVVAAR